MEQAPGVITSPPAHVVIFQMLMGSWTTKVLSDVTRLGVPDALQQHGPQTAGELTRYGSVKASPHALQRALRACAALGIFTEDASGRFGLTPISELLTRDAPGSLKSLTECWGGLLWKIWTGLPEALQTSEPQARAQLGMEFFEYLTAHPAAMEEFGEAMKANSFNVNRGLLAHYDFSGIRTVVDVGGGFGHLVVSLLEQYPDLRGVLFDLPDVIAAAPRQLPVRDASVAARLEYRAGDMFESVPSADAYVLKMIIHDWDDARCVAILRNCCEQLEDDSRRVICIDAVLPPLGDASDAPGKLLDVNMMLVLPGKERTRAEWEALYREAGLDVHVIIPIPDTYGTCIVEGRKRPA
jgi:hypothetical protein